MQKNKAASRFLSLKISSKHVGKWIIRPVAGIIARESLKLERLIEAIRFESHAHRIAIKDEIFKRIGKLEKSIEVMAREMASNQTQGEKGNDQ